MLRYVALCYAMLCYVMLCYVMLCYAMLCYVMLCYVMLCYVTLRYVTLRYVMLCYVMLCYVMLCYVMLCYVMSIELAGFYNLSARVNITITISVIHETVQKNKKMRQNVALYKAKLMTKVSCNVNFLSKQHKKKRVSSLGKSALLN